MSALLNEKSQQDKVLHCTKDYSIFKKFACNRPINQSHLACLIASIKTKNLLHLNPIIVDEQMRIMEGQHRVAAAEALGVPIYYLINDSSDLQDMSLLNSNRKNWSVEDYCNYYSELGNNNYIRLKKLSIQYGLKPHTILSSRVLGRDKTGGKDYSRFRTGHFIMPEGEAYENAVKCLDFHGELLNITKQLFMPKEVKGVINSDAFSIALLFFLGREDVIKPVLMSKLKIRAEHIKPCATRAGHQMQLKEIYNWKNQNPID